MRGRRWTAVAALTVGLGACLVPTATAEFGPIELVSKSAEEQADRAIEPAISANGRYVVFMGAIGGRSGFFHKDLDTGAIALVAEGSGEGTFSPSVSADGRYVSFTTTAALDPVNEGGTPQDSDVYVADMATSPPTYEIASARDGCDPANASPLAPCGLVYSAASGSSAAAASALSSDGRRVAFVTRSQSNLRGTNGDTPANQVVVRDLATDRTILVSAERDPLTGAMSAKPAPKGGVYAKANGAALSADGTTVAWIGDHLPDQVPLLVDEEGKVEAIEALPAFNAYLEPLWRRVPTEADPNPPTRRIVGGGDPLAAGCPPGGTLSVSACRGPFPDLTAERLRSGVLEEDGRGWGTQTPRLSADGNTAALLGNPDEAYDLFLVDMRTGLSRSEAVRRLTRWANPAPDAPNPEEVFESQYAAFTAPVADYAISPDGRRIAFTTVRQLFPLAPPTLITPQPAALVGSELYQVDLEGGTIERATPGPGQDVSQRGGAAAPSYAAGGRVLAFASTAFNLVPGDANEASDAFVLESPAGAPVGDSEISAPPTQPAVRPRWRLSATAVSRPDGTVRVVAVVPGAGMLRARAMAQLGPRLRSRRVAVGRKRSRAPRVLRLDLRLPRRLSGLKWQKGGLYATVKVSFDGPGGKLLHAQVVARFLAHRARGGEKP